MKRGLPWIVIGWMLLVSPLLALASGWQVGGKGIAFAEGEKKTYKIAIQEIKSDIGLSFILIQSNAKCRFYQPESSGFIDVNGQRIKVIFYCDDAGAVPAIFTATSSGFDFINQQLFKGEALIIKSSKGDVLDVFPSENYIHAADKFLNPGI
ncbi:hypothetical protein ACKWMY_06790 [Serratia sp. J2]|uniref:hypothetical protein n=1 Tax=Serratia sp. J2 TaxID=3386551 RepID=UPI0039174938